MRIGVIGTGVIASAVVAGIAGDGHEIVVSERSRARSGDLAARFGNVRVAGNQAVVDGCDLVLVALMADAAPGVLAELSFRDGQRVASLMAGVPLANVAAMVAPAKAEAILIPFPAIAAGGSPVLVCPPSDLLAGIFGRNNHVIGVPSEADLTPYMAAQALLSPVAKLLDEAAAWMAERTGDREGAERFLRILIGGGLAAAPYERAGVLAAMLGDLNTEGGFNAELRQHFEAGGAFDLLRAGLDKLESRQAGEA
ncbi:MAG: NAD(P)-binding domain-containing protein [Rhodobacteraceae bacterium]|nr:NAD(P)-binding domain-containing protein [Paracoccaceae bacterium]